MSATASSPTILLPMKLDAFVLNEKTCSGQLIGDAKVAPIVQPNYTFLRLDNFYIQNDVLEHTDLHFTTPVENNSRFTNLGTRQPRPKRKGVYLHWIIPRPYRLGGTTKNSQSGTPGNAASNARDEKTPQFQQAPSRWLVIRHLTDMEKIEPSEAPIKEVQAWVIESDLKRDLEKLSEKTDLQVDVSPFISADKAHTGVEAVEKQAEIFIGCKTLAEHWTEAPKYVEEDRASLNLLNSSNQLFADYQPHNNNVFSMVDNFEYMEGETEKYLTKAKASYFVIGWHPDYSPSLLEVSDMKDALSVRLSNMQMQLSEVAIDYFKDQLKDQTRANTLCHGTVYDVEWSQWKDEKEKPNIPANTFAKKLIGQLPVAVGTTSMDALLTFIHAHEPPKQPETGGGEKTATNEEPKKPFTVEQLLLTIESLLRARDDGVEAQRQAADLLVNSNYRRVDGGARLFLSGERAPGDTSAPTKLTETEVETLKILNRLQALEDGLLRTRDEASWRMFALWWQYMSDVDGPSKKDHYSELADQLWQGVTDLRSQLVAINNQKSDEKVIEKKIREAAKKATLPHFAQALDPTLLVGGIESGWPSDFLDKLTVRFATQTISAADKTSEDSVEWKTLFKTVIPKMATGIQEPARQLVHEFLALRPSVDARASDKPQEKPLYHDQNFQPTDSPGNLWRDRWERRQPWFPLFLEWEAEYSHIPLEHWSLEERTSHKATAAKLRYGIKPGVVVQDTPLEGKRTVTGRVLILPQPSFSLRAKIVQLFADTPPPILEKYLDDGQRKDLLDGLHKFAFLSAPLSGFTDHLVTRATGSHIKPNIRETGTGLKTLEAAKQKEAGFNGEWLDEIGAQTDLTPYASSVPSDPAFSVFKPLTHGQFRFTKLNIIDKFGQAIHAIDPTPYKGGPPPIFPCISEYYEPQSVDGKPDVANTVKQRTDGCEFVQLPPTINQLARINSAFMKLVEPKSSDLNAKPHWRPATEWENPIWGWLMVNYPNTGVQVFLHDGTFYREVRFGGPRGTQQSPPWLPFAPPSNANSPQPDGDGGGRSGMPSQDPLTKQLQTLCDKLCDPIYLQAVVNMITESVKNSPPAPGAYAEFLNAVVGRPVALVNMGWSLEIAVQPYENMSSLNPKKGPTTLLRSGTDSKQTTCSFQIKLGDREREYDGLLGYFNSTSDWREPPNLDNVFDMEKILTFFTKVPATPPPGATTPSKPDPRTPISKANYPLFEAFYVDTLDPKPVMPITANPKKPPPPPPLDSSDMPGFYESCRNSYYQIFAAMVDPFTPIHAYSAILPITTLTLSPWTWQEAMQRMTAFFRLGPLLVTANVPKFNNDYVLHTDYSLGDVDTVPGSAVGIPAGDTQDWAWLQPYIDESATKNDPLKLDGRRYMPLKLAKTDQRPRFENAPYTAVEGYLQMRKPVVRPVPGD